MLLADWLLEVTPVPGTGEVTGAQTLSRVNDPDTQAGQQQQPKLNPWITDAAKTGEKAGAAA
jgi:hypothetical protein